jgi:hypothetical protein
MYVDMAISNIFPLNDIIVTNLVKDRTLGKIIIFMLMFVDSKKREKKVDHLSVAAVEVYLYT